jgi:hypothetical protein
MLLSKAAGDAVPLHHFAVQAVCDQDGTEGSNPSPDRRRGAFRTLPEAAQSLGC